MYVQVADLIKEIKSLGLFEEDAISESSGAFAHIWIPSLKQSKS